MISLNAITKELVLACRQLGLTVSESLAALVARTIFNESTASFYAEAGGLQEPEARTVVEESVKKLFNTKQQPGMETLALQAAYETAALEGEQRVQQLAREQQEFEEKTIAVIVREGESRSVHLNHEQGAFVWGKILELVVKRACTPSMMKVTEHNKKHLDKEMQQILESVMPRVSLQRFLALTGVEKKAQLEELTRICFGIRLLNMKLEGGSDSTPVPLLLESVWTAQQLDEVLEGVQREVDDSTEMCRQWSLAAMKFPSKCCEELAHWRQRLAYWQNLFEDFTTLSDKLTEHRRQFDDLVTRLGEKIHAQKGTLNKTEVYPLFDALGKLMSAATLDLHLATGKLELRDLLKKSQFCPPLPKEIYDDLKAAIQRGLTTTTSAEKPSLEEISLQISALITEVHGAVPALLDTKAADQTSATAGNNTFVPPLVVSDHPMYLSPDDTPNFLQLPLDFQGYCVQRLNYVQSRETKTSEPASASSSTKPFPILCAGDPSLGVIQYKGRYCVFETFQQMQDFVKDPTSAFLNVREICYKYPQFIQLLRLHEDFPQSSLIAVLEHFNAQKLDDGSTQTPTHFLDSHIDENYEWNEWKLRKDALRMADIRRKTTSSTQTVGSTFRRENETQTFLSRDAATSTGAEKGIGTEKWTRFVGGLRGDKTQMKITNFKFEL